MFLRERAQQFISPSRNDIAISNKIFLTKKIMSLYVELQKNVKKKQKSLVFLKNEVMNKKFVSDKKTKTKVYFATGGPLT